MTNIAAVKTIAAAVDAAAARLAPRHVALVSPLQSNDNKSFTYQQLSQTTHALAAWLSLYGYQQHDVLLSDLPNTSENLLLQIACNRLGVGFGTTKSLEHMASTFPKVKGSVSATGAGFLAETNLPLPVLSGEFLEDLIQNGLDDFKDESVNDVVNNDTTSHAFFNSATPYTNQQALQHGREAAQELHMTDQDVVCVSITLCHAFGLGSAVCAALQTGATMVLPAVGGIQGCGVPSERAAATLQVLESEQCTLLFADTHTLKALPEPTKPLKLRDGVCKIGSGATFLTETREYGGVTLRTVGKPAE